MVVHPGVQRSFWIEGDLEIGAGKQLIK